MRPPYHIILAEDHLRFRQEIKKVLDEIPGAVVVAEVGEGQELFEVLNKTRPDLVLLDISMPNLRAMKATRSIKASYPEVKVIIMAMDEEKEYLSHAIAAGADGLLLKQNSARDLRTAIYKMRRGERYFPRNSEEKRTEGDAPYAGIFGCLAFWSLS